MFSPPDVYGEEMVGVSVTAMLCSGIPRTILKHLLAEWPNVGIMDGACGGQIEYLGCQSGTVSQG